MRILLCVFALALSLPAFAEEDRATKDDYEIDLAASSSTLAVGENGTFSVVIRAKNKTKIHPQAPLSVKLSPSDGVQLAKTKLSREDIAGQKKADENKDAKPADPDIRTQITGAKEGEQKVGVEVSFFLCTDAWCQRMNDKVELTVAVKKAANKS